MTTPATPVTPLLALLRALNRDQRIEFASEAQTTVSYLYQLAICSRGKQSTCRADLALRIENASRVMHKRYGTEVITMATLAQMCQECAT